MKTAIYDKNGIKIAGDHTLFSRLPAHILHAELPLIENGCLFSLLSDGNISVISAEEKALAGFAEPEKESRRFSRAEFVKTLLFGTAGNEIKELCRKYAFAYEQARRVFVSELHEDISSYIGTFEEMFDDADVFVIGLDGHRIAVICAEEENEVQEMAGAISATFAELTTDFNMGISCICDCAAELSNAFEQALSAIRVGKKISYNGGVWYFSNILPELVISGLPREGQEELRKKAEEISRVLDGETIELAQEFFRHNLNISETARYCYLHRNTLIYRLDRIQKETGFNMRNFDEAVALRIYIAANKLLK